MKNQILFLAFCCSGFLSASCNRPECRNSNPALSGLSPASEAYKEELGRQLAATNREELSYWVDTYYVEDGREYVAVNIQGEGLCATGRLLVNNWQKLNGIKQTKGEGYRGAELEGLKFNLQQISGKTEFVFQDVERIVD